MNDYKIYAVDFDGTLCENEWPEIGKPIQKIIDFCIRKRAEGDKLILWTCRSGENLKDAVKWSNEHGMFFHAINENLPEQIVLFGTDPRKIGADYFIDDRNLSLSELE
jgi:hydroxymethylpyrimidine pyrophosphatase-like HAD family hydrolase